MAEPFLCLSSAPEGENAGSQKFSLPNSLETSSIVTQLCQEDRRENAGQCSARLLILMKERKWEEKATLLPVPDTGIDGVRAQQWQPRCNHEGGNQENNREAARTLAPLSCQINQPWTCLPWDFLLWEIKCHTSGNFNWEFCYFQPKQGSIINTIPKRIERDTQRENELWSSSVTDRDMDGRRSAPHFQVFTSSLLQRAPNPFYCVYFSPLHPPAQKKSLAQRVKVCPGEILSTCAAYQCKDFGCKSTCVFFFLTTACIYIYMKRCVYIYIYMKQFWSKCWDLLQNNTEDWRVKDTTGTINWVTSDPGQWVHRGSTPCLHCLNFSIIKS